MATYASDEQVRAYLSENPELEVPADLAPLIGHGERDVDRAIGGPPILLATGLRLDPTLLSTAQRGALSRAVGAAVEFRLMLDAETLTGADDFVPGGEVTLIRRASRPPGPRVLEELAGFGLVRRSGCALPDPPPLPPVA